MSAWALTTLDINQYFATLYLFTVLYFQVAIFAELLNILWYSNSRKEIVTVVLQTFRLK